MPTSLPGIILALATFGVTFIVARTLAKWYRKRHAKRDESVARAAESRQVRRARKRKGDARD